MREFTFSIDYEAGADPLADVFINHPTLVAQSLHGSVTATEFWRIEQFVGPTAALDAVKRLRLDDTVDTLSVTESDCTGTRHHDVLEHTGDRLVVYTYMGDIDGGESVQTLAGRYLSPGSIFRTHRQEVRDEWCILMRSDEKVGLLYDALSANLRSGLSFRMGHLCDADGWGHDSLGSVVLPPNQRAALQAAADHGYYRTPREITLDELAAKLEIPRSTLSYRLRRVEKQLVAGYLGEALDYS